MTGDTFEDGKREAEEPAVSRLPTCPALLLDAALPVEYKPGQLFSDTEALGWEFFGYQQ